MLGLLTIGLLLLWIIGAMPGMPWSAEQSRGYAFSAIGGGLLVLAITLLLAGQF
jgi:hypothetical protein